MPFSKSVLVLPLLSYPLGLFVGLFATLPALAEADVRRADYSFTLTNDTSVDMLEFYVSPQTATDWEENVLGETTVRANGDWTLITVSGQRGCFYDFLAVFADGDKLEKYGINVCELETHTYYES